MNKMKILTIVGTRPELIRLSRVLNNLENNCDHVLVHTGQNFDYELNQVFFDELNIKQPDYFLNCTDGRISSATAIGNIISSVDSILKKEKPEAVLVLGDTNSCLSVIAAKRQKIPIFHMEAGNRCFDQRVPEEINRKIVDHTTDINLTYSNIAREYLLREGIPPDRVIKTGSPMFEVLSHHKSDISKSKALTKLNVKKFEYFLISAHREENIDVKTQFRKLANILNCLAEEFELPILVSTHPRTRNQITSSEIRFDDRIRFLKPLGFFDYVKLQENAKVVLSDSGTISEEASILNFPAINIREAHERPEMMEEASVIMTGLDKKTVFQALRILETQRRGKERNIQIVEDYNILNVSEKVVRIITSYTNYINQNVWKRY